MLTSMGFGRDRSARALADCGSLERAIDLLLGCGGDGGREGQGRGGGAGAGDGGDRDVRAVHSRASQYGEEGGRSACTAIALATARAALEATASSASSAALEGAVDAAFLARCVREGIGLHRDVLGGAGVAGGVEHSSVEELWSALRARAPEGDVAAEATTSTIALLPSSPRQGLLASSSGHPMGLEAVLSQCRTDAVDSRCYVAAVITKPPETVLVLLPPSSAPASSADFVLLDSHPRPQQLPPHFPSGSYALFHPSLASLVGSLSQIFPVTELGSDVPEMMAMMYNSFDVYPFRKA
ncbi:hypothetical protein ACHAWF_016284 [Thalassiosira exigua]